MDFDAKWAIGAALRVVRDATSVRGGMAELVALCRTQAPDDGETWDVIDGLDFDADARAIAGELAVGLSALDAEYTGFYFGLDGLNMPNGKGIEFGCSTGYAPGSTDDEWVYRCSHYPSEIRSAVLSELYRHVATGSFGDFVLCLGYLGLALRAAFERMDGDVALGGAPGRAIVFGFHDGDLFRLGVITPDGFELRYDETAAEWAAASASAAAAKPTPPTPSADEGDTAPAPVTRADWIRRAARQAQRVEDASARACLWSHVLTAVSQTGERPDDEMLDQALAAAESAPDPQARMTLRCAAAQAMARVGRASQARDVLADARRHAGALPEPFRRHSSWWTDRAEQEIAWAPAPAPAPAATPPATVRFWADPDSVEGRAIRLWETGRKTVAREMIGEAIDELVREGMASANQHHQMSGLTRLLDAQRAMGDVEGFRASASRIADAVEGWPMSRDWMSAAVLSELAPYLHEAGHDDQCRRSLQLALAAADEEKSASSNSHATVATALQKCGQLDEALKVAARVRPAQNRRKLMVELLTRGNRRADVEATYRAASSAPQRVELALAVVRAWSQA